jgi:HK97 family phage prohead protease
MSESLSRAFAADIEVRADGTGRTVHGIIVPFDRVARVSDGGPSYDEMFERGAFKKTIQERGDRVKLLSQHLARTNPLGRATLLREDAAGLYGEFHVSKTNAGDEALELLRDGALDSFSVGFAPIKHVDRNRVKVRTEVGLREASLVTFPAYEGALVGGVRSLLEMDDDAIAELARRLAEHPELRTTTPTVEPVDLGTSSDAAPADDEPLNEHSARHASTRFKFAAALRERGL